MAISNFLWHKPFHPFWEQQAVMNHYSQILSWFELHELSEELNTNPSPELEEHLTWAGMWPQKVVKAQAGSAQAAISFLKR